MIALFYEGHKNPNGAITYLEQLHAMLSIAEYDVKVFNIRQQHRTSKLYQGSDIDIHSIHADEAYALAMKNPTLLLQLPEDYHAGYANLLELDLPFIIHCGPGKKGMQLRQWSLAYVQDNPVITSGQSLYEEALKVGFTNVALIPIPYIRRYSTFLPYIPHIHAIAVGRVSSEKRTDIICQANNLLPIDKRVKIWGVVSGRMFAYYKLDALYPGWKNNYMGSPQDIRKSTAQLCRQARYGIDLTQLAWGGNRVQYTTLEMMDAGCTAIMNRAWLKFPGELEEGNNCLAIDTAEELAELLIGNTRTVDRNHYIDILAAHSKEAVLPSFLEVIHEA